MASKQTPTIGRIVHYRLTAEQAEQVNRRRTSGQSIATRQHQIIFQRPGGEPVAAWPIGAQAHIGNPVTEGTTIPLTITAVCPEDGINGQGLLDGNDSLWVTTVYEGEDDTPGTWSWPPKV